MEWYNIFLSERPSTHTLITEVVHVDTVSGELMVVAGHTQPLWCSHHQTGDGGCGEGHHQRQRLFNMRVEPPHMNKVV